MQKIYTQQEQLIQSIIANKDTEFVRLSEKNVY